MPWSRQVVFTFWNERLKAYPDQEKAKAKKIKEQSEKIKEYFRFRLVWLDPNG